MSRRYKGARISATPPTTTGGESGTAPGAWTLQSQNQAQAAGLWPLGPQPKYIEDVFSTWLYNGTGANQTITNNIDLSTKGGLVWIKPRTIPTGGGNHSLFDTVRGVTKGVQSNLDATEQTWAGSLTSFNTNGFTLGSDGASSQVNVNTCTYASWTFREQVKFFDVVTWTGNGTTQNIAHNLGSVPGCIFVKKLSGANDWMVYHRSLASGNFLRLNTTAASASGGSNVWGDNSSVVDPTSTVFTIGNEGNVNANGATFVAYVFAHDAGGFGLTGTDDVISCGSFTTDGAAAATVSLGYEPQWVLFKRTDSATNGDWVMFDNMRGLPATGSGSTAARLIANTSAAENPTTGDIKITSTGFVIDYVPSASFIYIAIRRGPMKVPTDATKVFKPIFSTTAGAKLTTGFPVDMQFEGYPPGDSLNMSINDRLRGVSTNTTQSTKILTTSSTVAEASPNSTMTNYWDNTGFTMPGYYGGLDYISWSFQRAPSFYDEVCYTGTGTPRTVTHNLAAVPELMIVKGRNGVSGWRTYVAPLGPTQYVQIQSTNAAQTYPVFNDTAPTSSVFTVGTDISGSGTTYVAYLFATCAGVSKVGSYTGTATTQTINCGFTGGARFVLIKRTDSTGDWYIWDTARGMVSGTDPYLLLNTQSSQVNANNVYTATTGFQIVGTGAGFNASGGTYIFLAIA